MADQDLDTVYQKLVDQGATDGEIHDILQQYKATHQAQTPINPNEPGTYLGGFIKGAKEGIVGGAKGFVEGALHPLSTAPEITAGSAGGAGADPEGFGKSVGSATTQAAALLAAPKVVGGLGRMFPNATGGAIRLLGRYGAGLLPEMLEPKIVKDIGGAIERQGADIQQAPIRVMQNTPNTSGYVPGQTIPEAPGEISPELRASTLGSQGPLEPSANPPLARFNEDVRSLLQKELARRMPVAATDEGVASLDRGIAANAKDAAQTRTISQRMQDTATAAEQKADADYYQTRRTAEDQVDTAPSSAPSTPPKGAAQAASDADLVQAELARLRGRNPSLAPATAPTGEGSVSLRDLPPISPVASHTQAPAAVRIGASPTVAMPQIPDLQGLVEELRTAHGSAETGRMLASDPAFAGMSPTERTNTIRLQSGGPAGQLPEAAQRTIDTALASMTPAEQKAYLLRAPNAAAYEYIRQMLKLK